MSHSDEYVFPQTPAEDENFNRTGGLTKRELLAGLFVANGRAYLPPTGDVSTTSIEYVMKGSVYLADLLLAELEKKP